MLKIYTAILVVLLVSGCYGVPSSEEIENDIASVEKEIEIARATANEYSSGLIASLVKVRLETLNLTKSMLDQKNKGIKRFIPVSYSIDGVEYRPPIKNRNIWAD